MFNRVFKKKNLPAFTLVEVILYIALFSSVITVFVGFIGMNAQLKGKNEAAFSVDSEALKIFQNISQTAKNASSISFPAEGANASSLSLAVDTPALTPTVYGLSSGRVQITEGAGQPVFLSSDRVSVTNLTFRNMSNGTDNELVRVELTLEYINSDNRKEKEYSQTYYTSINLR